VWHAPNEQRTAHAQDGRALSEGRQKPNVLDVPPTLNNKALPPEMEQMNNQLVRPFREMIRQKSILLIVMSALLWIIIVALG